MSKLIWVGARSPLDLCPCLLVLGRQIFAIFCRATKYCKDLAAEDKKTRAQIKRTPGADPDQLGHRASAALERRVATGAVSEWPPDDRIALGVKLLELLGQTGFFKIG